MLLAGALGYRSLGNPAAAMISRDPARSSAERAAIEMWACTFGARN
jgi:hypothetical protein